MINRIKILVVSLPLRGLSNPMDIILYIISGPLFLISIAAHFYVRIRLRPKDDSDLDEYYYEFEDQHPAYAKYTKWSRITFSAAAIAALLLFIAMVI